MISLAESTERDELGKAKIKVVGVGGCGCNAINSLVRKGITDVELIAVNSDNQALKDCLAPIKIQAGKSVTKNLGTGARPEIGQKAVQEVRDEIQKLLEGSDLVFVTAGMGKGTGTGGAPVVAEIAKSIGALVIGIVFLPFKHEGSKRLEVAKDGIKRLRESVDTLIVISNDKLLSVVGNSDVRVAIDYGNEVLVNAVRGITDIITKPGLINVDFMDVKTIMQDMGDALLGTGIGRGEHRATEAVQKAISNPLVEGLSIVGAKGVLINFVGNKVTFNEVKEACEIILEKTGEDVNLISGVVIDESMNDELMVTVIATGLESSVYTSPRTAPSSPTKKIRTVYEKDEDLGSAENINIPAYIRRGVIIYKNEKNREQENKSDENDKPSFLRQVMD